MDRSVLELLAKLHGVQFDENTSDDDLAKSLGEAIQASNTPPTPPPSPTPPPTPPTPPSPPANPNPPAPTSRLTPAMAEQVRHMAEDNEYIKAVLSELEDQRRRVAELEVANRLQDVRRKIGDVGNGRRILAPQASAKLSELVAAMPPKAGDKVLEVVKEILDDGGTVELGERGRAVLDSGKDAGTRFNAEVQKLMEADPNISYADATSAVAAANPDLFESYRYSATSEWR